jgi:hypothetical protein
MKARERKESHALFDGQGRRRGRLDRQPKVHVIERLSDGKLRLAIEAPESLEIDRHVIREQKQAQLLPREPGALERSLRQQA